MALDTAGALTAEVTRSRVAEENPSDHALIEATKQGDESAFAEIVHRYQNPIVNYLYRFLNDYEEAVDLAQETFVRVYFAIDRYHSGFAFSTYIYRIATNLAISEIRKRKRRKLLSLTGLFQSDAEEQTEFQPKDERSLPDEDLVDDEQSRVIVSPAATRWASASIRCVWTAISARYLRTYSSNEIGGPRLPYHAAWSSRLGPSWESQASQVSLALGRARGR